MRARKTTLLADSVKMAASYSAVKDRAAQKRKEDNKLDGAWKRANARMRRRRRTESAG